VWFRRVAQAGLFARGVIYLVLAGLAFEIAVKGTSSARLNSQGAFAEIARQPSGPALLAVLAVGFASYAGWRLVQAIAGEGKRRRSAAWIRLGQAATALLYLVFCAEAVRLIAGADSTAGGDEPGPIMARVLTWRPGGPEIVGLVAVGVAIGGIALGAWGVAHDYGRVLDKPRMRHGFTAARIAGALGDAARGVLFLLLAGYLFLAAVTEEPKNSKGIGSAAQAFAHEPAGPEVLSLVGIGLICFGCYSVVEGIFRRSPE
jgi:hypothetical protein